MFVVRAVEGHAGPLGEFTSRRKQAVGLHHSALAVHSLGFYRVELRALLGQRTADDPDALAVFLTALL
jgi:hypothetical protein